MVGLPPWCRASAQRQARRIPLLFRLHSLQLQTRNAQAPGESTEKIHSAALTCWQQPHLLLDSANPSYMAYSRY